MEAPPQNPGEGAGAPPPPEEMVTIPKKDFDDLSHRAGVSSQNFERLKKAEDDLAEARRLQSASNPSTPDPVLAGKVQTLESEVSTLTEKLTKADVVKTYPQLDLIWADLETYRQDPANKGMSLATAAKAFMTEKGLLDPQREGIERPTGGPRVPPQSGMTNEQVKHLRETDYRKYSEMLQAGQIKIID